MAQMERAAELHLIATQLQPAMASAYNSLGNAQRALENPLAQAILEGRVNDGDEIKVSAGKDGLLINGERAQAA